MRCQYNGPIYLDSVNKHHLFYGESMLIFLFIVSFLHLTCRWFLSIINEEIWQEVPSSCTLWCLELLFCCSLRRVTVDKFITLPKLIVHTNNILHNDQKSAIKFPNVYAQQCKIWINKNQTNDTNHCNNQKLKRKLIINI